jgi:hypothetical protein
MRTIILFNINIQFLINKGLNMFLISTFYLILKNSPIDNKNMCHPCIFYAGKISLPPLQFYLHPYKSLKMPTLPLLPFIFHPTIKLFGSNYSSLIFSPVCILSRLTYTVFRFFIYFHHPHILPI